LDSTQRPNPRAAVVCFMNDTTSTAKQMHDQLVTEMTNTLVWLVVRRLIFASWREANLNDMRSILALIHSDLHFFAYFYMMLCKQMPRSASGLQAIREFKKKL
jgi:hypothetical protein